MSEIIPTINYANTRKFQKLFDNMIGKYKDGE